VALLAATTVAAASGASLAASGLVVHRPVSHKAVPRPTATSTPAVSVISPAPTAVPEPAVPVAASVAGQLYQFDAPSVGIHIPVVAVGVKNGAMEAPEGPLGSVFWREAFWLNLGSPPGHSGTATLAGHLDDIAGRPAAFWNIRQFQVGHIVSFTRLADGKQFRYRISQVGVWTDTQASTQDMLQRLYGTAAGGVDDGVARLSMITCTGHWRGPALGYDHRFMAFAELI